LPDVRVLLAELIDHAPMFPPARLPLPEALEDHRAARASAASWMLARFVSPASALQQLPEGLRVSAVLADGRVDGVEAVEDVEAAEAVEVRVSDADAIRAFPSVEAEAYFEPTQVTSCYLLVDAIRERGAAAKVRCGGERVPTVDELAAFIRACRQAGVPFKATAGLHHAVRTDGEHGFLNLLAAAGSDDVEAMLESKDLDELLAVDPRRAREALRSIGSCSFWEPVDELKRLGVLPR
jgi:hypothetical protein